MSLFADIDCSVDYADSTSLYESLGSKGSNVLVLVKTGVSFESMVADYMKWVYASIKKHGASSFGTWYGSYPKESFFAVTPLMAPRMVGLIPKNEDTIWKVYSHQESGHLFAQFVSGPTPPKEVYFAALHPSHRITCTLALCSLIR